MVKASAEFCPDCGAPIAHEDAPNEGSDAAIYPELARANLLRMRGEFKQAEDICLSILRRYPNNATANGLLGDMKAEQGDLEQAAEWYELALDLVDDSAVKNKLHQVKRRIQEREAANTAKQIGLPTGRSKMGLYMIIMIVLIGGSATAAFILGQQSNKSTTAKKSTMDRPLNIPTTTTSGREQSSETDSNEAAENAPAQTPSAKPEADRALIQAISQLTPLGAKMIDAFQDPRSKDITITFMASEGEGLRDVAAELGKAALTSHLESNRVVLRGISGTQVGFVADMTRDSLHNVETAEWKEAHANDPKAWTNAVLTNVWPPTLNSETNRTESNTDPSERGDASGQPLQGN